MAFAKLAPAPSRRQSPLRARLREDPRGRGRTELNLSAGAERALGSPSAVFFEWDEDSYRMRVVASSPDDPASRTLGKYRRLAVGDIFKMIGVEVRGSHPIRVVADGPVAVILDLSPLRCESAGREDA